MAKQSKSVSTRLRFSIPDDDAAALEWISKQHHLSISLRMLIHNAIEDNGIRDILANKPGEVTVKARRGRPPQSHKSALDDYNYESNNNVTNSSVTVEHESNNKSKGLGEVNDKDKAQERLKKMTGLVD